MTTNVFNQRLADLAPTIPGYRVTLCLGKGGYASVWLAWRQGSMGIQIPVAIKVLNPEHSKTEAARRRFLAEAKLIASLDHPNIIKVLDANFSNGRPYYAMEYVRGTSLARLLRKKKRGLPIDAALQIGVRIGSALAAAHRATDHRGRDMNVVHRDVNPANILLGQYGLIKLIDFGIATSEITPRDTRINHVKGNPRYLAPEQAFGIESDGRTDTYALGLTVYEALTGFAPLATDDTALALTMAREPKIPKPSEHRPALGSEIDGVILRALRREPSQRYDSIDEFVRALHSCLLSVNPTLLNESLHLLVSEGDQGPARPPEETTSVVAETNPSDETTIHDREVTLVDDPEVTLVDGEDGLDELQTSVFRRATPNEVTLAVLQPIEDNPRLVVTVPPKKKKS